MDLPVHTQTKFRNPSFYPNHKTTNSKLRERENTRLSTSSLSRSLDPVAIGSAVKAEASEGEGGVGGGEKEQGGVGRRGAGRGRERSFVTIK